MPTLRIGLVIGSLRAGSFNRQLADAVRTLAGDRFVFEEIGIGVTVTDSNMLEPEMSTSAVMAHRPRARIFNRLV